MKYTNTIQNKFGLSLDLLVVGIIHRVQRELARISLASNLDFPLALSEVALVDHVVSVGSDKRKSNSTTKSVAVRGSAYIADTNAVTEENLSVVHAGLRIGN